MPQRLQLFRIDLLMSIEIKLHPVLVFDVFQDEFGRQSAIDKKSSTGGNPVYRIRVRAKSK